MLIPVHITGIGPISPFGIGKADHCKAIMTGLNPLDNCNVDDLYYPKIVGLVPDFNPKDYIMDKKSIRFMTRQVILGLCSSSLALQDAGITSEILEKDIDGTGVIFGAGIVQSIISSKDIFLNCLKEEGEIDYKKLGREGYRAMPPLWILPRLPNTIGGQISIQYGIKGINYSIVNGPSSGMIAIGEAYEAICNKRSSLVVSGGSEWDPAVDFIDRLKKDGFASDTENGSRPFSGQSDGFILAEGAASLILESEEKLYQRGGKSYGKILAYGNGYVPRFRNLDVKELAQQYCFFVRTTLERNSISLDSIDLVQATGCGIPVIDDAEIEVYSSLFGSKTLITTVNGSIGYPLAASGAISSAVAILEMEMGIAGVIGRTTSIAGKNQEQFVIHNPKKASIQRVLCTSFDYSGAMVCLVIEKKG